MYAALLVAMSLFLFPAAGFAQEADKDTCAKLSGLQRVICVRETTQRKAQANARGKITRGRARAAETYQQFENRNGVRLKQIGSGERRQSVRTSVKSIGEKVKYMTKDERKILKGKMGIGADVSAELQQREKLRRVKTESLKKRIHRR